MGYLRNAIDHAKYMAPFVFKGQEQPSWADSLSLARDSFHSAALIAAGVALGVEMAGNGVVAHAVTIGLGGLSLISEMGAHVNNVELQRELSSDTSLQTTEAI